MRKLLLLIILLSSMIILGSCKDGEITLRKPIVEIRCIMCDEVEMITGIESIEEHLLFISYFTEDNYSEIIDDDYG